MEGAIQAILDKLAAGGPAAGWLLAVYLLGRLHQLTDRQHKANLDTVKVLTAIRTVLFVRGGPIFGDGE